MASKRCDVILLLSVVLGPVARPEEDHFGSDILGNLSQSIAVPMQEASRNWTCADDGRGSALLLAHDTVQRRLTVWAIGRSDRRCCHIDGLPGRIRTA